MQQRQHEQRFSDTKDQYVHLFPQNRPGYQQPVTDSPADQGIRRQKQPRTESKETKPRRRIKIFSWWNLFAVIGFITVVIQLIRYVIVPVLVYLNVLVGGTL